MSWFLIKFIRLRYWLRSAFNKQYKPTIEEFLTLPVHWQFDWISKNIDDYEMRLYGDGYLGISYPVDTDILDQYMANPLDYGVSNLLFTQIQDISETRSDQIDEGASLTKDEVDALKNAIAQDDIEGWTLHSGFEFELADGNQFVLFRGYGEGQAGPRYEYDLTLPSKDAALDFILEEPLGSVV